MVYIVRVSSSFVIDLGADEAAPAGFDRRQRWPEGRFALQHPMVVIDEATASSQAARFEKTIFGQLEFFENDPSVTKFRGEGRGRLRMLITFEPAQGYVYIAARFLSRWGAMGGDLELDTPLDP